MKRALIIILILLLPLAVAKGSSSYLQSPTQSSKQCDSWGKLDQRIECRLAKQVGTDVPEACLNLANEKQCTAFYVASGPCYDLPNADKDNCFREFSGYDKKQAGVEKRFYVTSLLYEMQEYVEDDYDDGKMTAAQVGPLIAEIIEMKRILLAGGSFDTIKPMLETYKGNRGLQ